MFQTLYKKCLELAAHKSSNFYLGLVSFIESSFFKTSKIAFLLLSAACVFLQRRLSGGADLLDIRLFKPK